MALLVGVAIGLAYERRIAAVFVGASVAVFVLLRGVAAGLMALARRLPRSRITMLRLAIANIHRPGALTPSLVLSLGLGLALLVTLALIDGNLRRSSWPRCRSGRRASSSSTFRPPRPSVSMRSSSRSRHNRRSRTCR